ncbi:hypothetical protein [Streptomyces coeruleorubidus]|uniref:Uncharacterized protein n=1 Tax=Streptomyces coeruleorubidus TaxID=116188 RepID=A0A5J6HUE1_STRC4|nr:hypothetical protein [Streptomyces coeruleorubidus]QEV23979.1 hypothetical protein CP976_07345 [Streptomyces coeruleorubidus]GGT85647.1 hypothetical protein GCM10010256_52200 [Streptomyces coeruleorubidus]
MADSPDAPFTRYDEQLRAITDLDERWAKYLELAEFLDSELELWRRRQRQEIAMGFRDEGKTWKEIGKSMGDVSFQRAFQYGKGE